MKWYHRLCSVVIVSLLVLGGSSAAFADEAQQEIRQLADELVENPDPQLQAAGFLAIGHVGSADQRDSLEDHQDARGIDERLAVGTAMVAAGQGGAESFLAEQLLEAPELGDAVMQLVAHLTEDQLLAVIEEVLEEGDERDRSVLFSFLARQTGTLYSNLTDRLTAGDESQREAALEAVLEIPGEAALEAAEELADHHDADIRGQALDIADAVGAKGDAQSRIVALLEAMVGDADQDNADAAARRLVKLEEQRGVDHLVGRLSEMDEDQRVETLEYLVDFDFRADIDQIRPLIEEAEMAMAAEEADRQREWQLLYEVAATDADDALVDDLMEKFSSTDFADRIAAVRSLGRTDRPEAQQRLINAMGEGRSDIRRYAARGLGHMANPEVLSNLRSGLQGEAEQDVRIEMVNAIGQIRDAEAANMLRFVVNDDDPKVRMAIVEALGEIGLPESIPSLELLLRDREDDIGWKAFVTVLSIDPQRARGHARGALQNPPDDFGDVVDPRDLNDEARELLYEGILSHSAGRVYMVAIDHALTHRDKLLDILRSKVASDDVTDAARRRLAHAIITDRQDEDLAVLDRVVREHRDEDGSAEFIGWHLVHNASSAFEETFEYLIALRDMDDDPTTLYVIARSVLANLD